MSKKLPDFLIVGPPKTASTSLHYYLSQHPQIYMSAIKETRFLDNNYSEDLSQYEKFFTEVKDEKAIGEGTPTYSFLPFVADRIKKHFPEMKLLFCFRDPVERAFSGWAMRRAKGGEKNSFREALKLNLEQRKTVRFQGDEGERLWLKDQDALNNRNQIVYRTYIEGSMYAEQLKCYRERFNDSQIKIILMDDLKNDLKKTLRDIFVFLNVDAGFTHIKTEAVNKHKKVRLKTLFNLFGKTRVKNVKKYLPVFAQNLLKPVLRTEEKKPKISAEDKLFAYNIFWKDIQELESIIGRDLSAWKQHGKIIGV